jgi:hypothetical protein
LFRPIKEPSLGHNKNCTLENLIVAEEPRVDGRIILKWNFKKWDEGYGLD